MKSAFGSVTPIFSFDNVKCDSLESDLVDCPHVNDNDCRMDEGAAGNSVYNGESSVLGGTTGPG